jgi:hypothetical protein
MLDREVVREALSQAWQKKVGGVYTGAFDAQADAIMALLPDAEALGRAARLVARRKIHGLGWNEPYILVGPDAGIGRAILEELRKEREG